VSEVQLKRTGLQKYVRAITQTGSGVRMRAHVYYIYICDMCVAVRKCVVCVCVCMFVLHSLCVVYACTDDTGFAIELDPESCRLDPLMSFGEQ